MVVLTLLTACSEANASVIYKGQTYTLLQMADNVQLTREQRAVFDARLEAQRILKTSSCQNLSYRMMPLSKIGSTFSFLEEIFLEGGDCGIRGYSYRLVIRNINLQTGKSDSVFRLASEQVIADKLKRDTYLKKITPGQSWTIGNLDQSFFDWNAVHCAGTVSKYMFRQFYIFDARTRPAKVRLALPFACLAPADDVQMPTQIGLLLNINFNKTDDFDFLSIRDKIGQGIRLQLKQP